MLALIRSFPPWIAFLVVLLVSNETLDLTEISIDYVSSSTHVVKSNISTFY